MIAKVTTIKAHNIWLTRHRAGAAVALTLEVGPAVRIRFPPAASLMRTRLAG
jgi:hypothetical protein